MRFAKESQSPKRVENRFRNNFDSLTFNKTLTLQITWTRDTVAWVSRLIAQLYIQKLKWWKSEEKIRNRMEKLWKLSFFSFFAGEFSKERFLKQRIRNSKFSVLHRTHWKERFSIFSEMNKVEISNTWTCKEACHINGNGQK